MLSDAFTGTSPISSQPPVLELAMAGAVVRIPQGTDPGLLKQVLFYTERPAMLGDITAVDEIYIVCGYTDMRRSIDGLCAIVQDRLRMVPRRRALYLFCEKRCDRIRCLLWENDGFLLLYKRMEAQSRFRWPRSSDEVKTLT